MIKKTITYRDYDNNRVTEDFWFDINETEVLERELSHNLEGGYASVLKRVGESQDGKQVLPLFKELIFDSYGVRQANRFYKTPEAVADFVASGAYNALFLEFMTNAGAFAEFVRGILPDNLEEISDRVVTAAQNTQQAQDEARAMVKQPQDHQSKSEHDGRSFYKPAEPLPETNDSPSIRDLVRFDYADGHSILEIAEKFDRRPSEVQSYLED